jgi:hypothetical protein
MMQKFKIEKLGNETDTTQTQRYSKKIRKNENVDEHEHHDDDDDMCDVHSSGKNSLFSQIRKRKAFITLTRTDDVRVVDRRIRRTDSRGMRGRKGFD